MCAERDGEEQEGANEQRHVVKDDAENFALQSVSGRDVDGLVLAPDHEGDGDGGVKGENCFSHIGES